MSACSSEPSAQRGTVFTKSPSDVLDHAASEIASGSKLGIDAQLIPVAACYTLRPAFQHMLANHAGDLSKFYAEAKATTSLPKKKRQERMTVLVKSVGVIIAEETH